MIQKLSTTNNNYVSTSTATQDQRQVTYVGDPHHLKTDVLRLPKTLVPILKNRLLTWAAMRQLTHCENRPRDYFGTCNELSLKSGLPERTTKSHLSYLTENSPPGIDHPYITRLGRQRRRTVTYAIDPEMRELAGRDYWMLPMIARERLTSWGAKILFAYLTNRWLAPLHTMDSPTVGYESEDLEQFHIDCGTAVFRIVPTARTLGVQRSTLYQAIPEIEEFGLGEFYAETDRTEFSFHVRAN